MAHPWEAEQTIDPQVALALVADQFPDLQATTIELLGVGWDNTAYLINKRYVFRFPRRRIAVPLIMVEHCLLPKIADRLPLPTPMPKWMGTASKEYPWPFIGYQNLPGVTGCRANLSDAERAAMAPQLAQFLSALHAIPLTVARECHLPGDALKRLKVSRIAPIAKKNLDELEALEPVEGRKALLDIIDDADSLRPPVETTIVHGDFYIRHLLIDDSRRLAGIIDWGDVHIGDPALDITVAHSFLPQEAHETFRRAYGDISDETWRLARLRAIYSSTFLAVYGHHIGDQAIANEGLRSLRNIAAIHSR